MFDSNLPCVPFETGSRTVITDETEKAGSKKVEVDAEKAKVDQKKKRSADHRIIFSAGHPSYTQEEMTKLGIVHKVRSVDFGQFFIVTKHSELINPEKQKEAKLKKHFEGRNSADWVSSDERLKKLHEKVLQGETVL